VSTTTEPDPLARALMALQLGRTEQAERLLRDAVAADPTDAFVYAVLALVLADLERYEEAEDCAREAIAFDPELAVAQAALARALIAREQFRAAAAATREAIRLDPEDSGNHELLAACQLADGDWHGARASAEQALRLEPESAIALGLRARALAMTTDDPAAWGPSAAAALAADPGSSAAHALAAHAYLTRGHEKRAVAGFEEALRLDPESAYAQAGLAESLKAAHPLFRPLYRFFMWQQRLSGGTRAALIIVPFIAARAASTSGNPILIGVAVAWFAFVALNWLGPPIANLALRLSPRGRAILPAEQKRSSTLFAALVGGCVLAFVLAVLVAPPFAVAAVPLALLAFSAGSYHALSARRRRVYIVVVVAVVVAAFLAAVLQSVGVDAGVGFLLAAVIAGVALLWFVRFA